MIIIIISIIIIIDTQYIAMSARYIQYIAFNPRSARFLIALYTEKNSLLNKFACFEYQSQQLSTYFDVTQTYPKIGGMHALYKKANVLKEISIRNEIGGGCFISPFGYIHCTSVSSLFYSVQLQLLQPLVL